MANVFFNLEYGAINGTEKDELKNLFGITDIIEMRKITHLSWKKPSKRLVLELDYWHYRDMADEVVDAILDSGYKTVYAGLPKDNPALSAIFCGLVNRHENNFTDKGVKVHLLLPIYDADNFILWLEVN